MDSASSPVDQVCKRVAGSANGASPYQPGATPQVRTPESQGLNARLINPQIAAVIPCFNEEQTIGALVSQVRQHLDPVVVVDDGSTDQTALNAEREGATVLRHDRNRGKGAALHTGLSYLHRLGCEWAVTLDGDGQHDPADLPSLIKCAEQSGALLVIGNRMGNAEAMPWLRRYVNRWMSNMLSQYSGRSLPDTQSGFRLIHLRSWAELPLSAQRFEVESETLMAFLGANHPVEFVPIHVVPSTRKSRIHPIADSLRWWKWWSQMKKHVAHGQWKVTTRETSPSLQRSCPPSCPVDGNLFEGS